MGVVTRTQLTMQFLVLISLAAAAVARPQIEPYQHVEIAAEPYIHQEVAAEPYVHIEPALSPEALGNVRPGQQQVAPAQQYYQQQPQQQYYQPAPVQQTGYATGPWT